MQRSTTEPKAPPQASDRHRHATLPVVLMLLAALCLELMPGQVAARAVGRAAATRALAAPSDGAGPRLFFSDLESGPNVGGQDSLGAFVTIYGEGFGASRGASTVTIGGREVAKYALWGQDNAPARKLDRIVVQLGPRVASGHIVVTVGGKASNPLPFIVRPGNLYFVSASGKDSSSGSFGQPWRTIVKAKNTIASGGHRLHRERRLADRRGQFRRVAVDRDGRPTREAQGNRGLPRRHGHDRLDDRP